MGLLVKWRLNITVKLVGYLLVASLVPLILLGLSAFEISKRVVVQQAESENARLLAGFASYLKLYDDQVNDMAANIAGNEAIGLSLRMADEGTVSAYDNLEIHSNMGRMLNSYVRVKGLVSIDVLSIAGAHFHVGETLNVSKVSEQLTSSLLNEALASRAPTLWRGVDNNLNTGSEQKKVISVVRAIRHYSSITGKSDTVGLLVINLNDEIMRAYLQGIELAPGSQLFQLDQNGNIALHSDPQQFGQALAPALLNLVRSPQGVDQFTLNDVDVVMNVAAPDELHRLRVFITPRKLLTQKVNELAVATFVLIGLGLLLILGITLIFVRTIVRPIRAVSDGFRQLADNPDQPHKTLHAESTDDEVDLLVKGYNAYLGALGKQRAVMQDLLRAQEDRRATETMLTTAIDAMGEAFAVFDVRDRLLFCNDKFRNLYPGVSDAVVPGNSHEAMLRLSGQHGNYGGAPEGFEDWVRERLALHRAGETDINDQLSDGRWIRVVERKTAHGEIVSFRTDITALMEAQRSAIASSEAKSQFLANMSHEIRTPMNAILGLLDLLQSTEMTDRQRDYVSKTDGAARSLLGLLNDILDFSKIEAGKMTLENEPFRIGKLLRNLSTILSSNVGNKDIEVLFDIDPDLPPMVRGDAMRLQQVLINLGGNAVKFTSKGQVVVSVHKLTQAEGKVTLKFVVQDTGIGIPLEHQAHIFSGFSQAESSTTRRFGGTGLGLAISKRFVEMMGGDIELSSEPEVGSRFSFAVEMPTVAVADSPELPAEDARPAIQARRVLVVDDNPVAGNLIVGMVRSWGWTAELANSGKQALEMIVAAAHPGDTEFPYPLIYMDWKMPQMDGWETTRQVRLLAHNANLPQPQVLMITAHGRETLAMRTEAEQDTINGFLVKPVTASMLFDALMEASSGNSAIRRIANWRSSKRQLNGMRILLVEDNLINQQVADELLTAQGAIVSLAANGQLGVDAVAAAAPQFDVVLMDMQMPVLDGYGATRAIRQNLSLTDLPIIAMTANAMASDRETCIAAGMNEHVGKPFDMAKLIALLIRVTGFQAESSSAADATPTSIADAQAVPVVPGLDMQTALNRMSGMRSLYLRSAKTFVKDMDNTLSELKRGLASGEQLKVKTLLHTLKGNAGTLGATSLAEIAARLENACTKGEGMQQCQRELDDLASVIELTQNNLQAAIASLEPAPAATKSEAAQQAQGTVSAATLEALRRIRTLVQASDLEALVVYSKAADMKSELPDETLNALDTALQELNFAHAARLCDAMLQQFEN